MLCIRIDMSMIADVRIAVIVAAIVIMTMISTMILMMIFNRIVHSHPVV